MTGYLPPFSFLPPPCYVLPPAKSTHHQRCGKCNLEIRLSILSQPQPLFDHPHRIIHHRETCKHSRTPRYHHLSGFGSRDNCSNIFILIDLRRRERAGCNIEYIEHGHNLVVVNGLRGEGSRSKSSTSSRVHAKRSMGPQRKRKIFNVSRTGNIPILSALVSAQQSTGGDDNDMALHRGNGSRTDASARSENGWIIWSVGYWPRYRSTDRSVETVKAVDVIPQV